MSEIQTFESISEYRTLECNIFKCEEKVTKIWHSTDLSIEFGKFFFAHLLMMLCCLWGVPLVVQKEIASCQKMLGHQTLWNFYSCKKSEEGFQFSISKCNGPSHLILLIVKHLYYSHCRPDELAPYYNNLICNVFHVWYQKYLGNKALCHYYLIYY